jgi:hypothetical protein
LFLQKPILIFVQVSLALALSLASTWWSSWFAAGGSAS